MASLHEKITRQMTKIIEATPVEDRILPDSLAEAVLARYSRRWVKLDPIIEYAAREQLKQIARGLLAQRFHPANEQSEAENQGELFTGKLQTRYPEKHSKGETPSYLGLEYLTLEDIEWNGQALIKSGKARIVHGKALIAFGENKFGVRLAVVTRDE